MKLSDIIQEGKISQEGIREIENIIKENNQLKEAFGFTTWWNGTQYYSREEVVNIKEAACKLDILQEFYRMSVREFRKRKKLNK